MKTRIFIACADERLRLGMFLLLDSEPDMAVVGIADRLTGLLAQLEATQANVLLLDWDMPRSALRNILADVHALRYPPKIIVFASKPEEEGKLIQAGADHSILKNAPPDELFPILRSISYVEQKSSL